MACVNAPMDDKPRTLCKFTKQSTLLGVILLIVAIFVGSTVYGELASIIGSASLDITNLQDVLTSLREVHFGSYKWRDLGLELGLFDNRLRGIEANQRGNVDECLRECLSKWLARVDQVDEKGGATWAALAKALKNIGDNPAAEHIAKALRNIGDKPAAEHIERQYVTDNLKSQSQAYYKALEEGDVSVKWSKFSLSGPPGSGKSSVMDLLLGNKPPLQHQSTNVVTEPQVRYATTTTIVGGSSWKRTDLQSIKKMIAKELRKGEISRNPTFMNYIMSLLSMKDDHVEKQHSKSSGFSEAANHIVALAATSQDIPHPRFAEVHFIYGVDSGGQAAFLDIAPALIRYNSVNILTHRLNESLDDKPKFIYSVHGKPVGEPIERQITHLQLLEASIRSSAFITSPNLQLNKVSDPIFLILGTFLDKIKDSKESLNDKNKKLLSQFKQYLKNETLKWYAVEDEAIIYPVNTIDREKETRDLAEKLRSTIQDRYIEASVPARWFLFQLELDDYRKKQSTSVVSLSECERIGRYKSIKMDPGDVKAALLYYNDLTIFLYFPNVLPQVVFLHPQLLFKKLSDLISISFADTIRQLRKLKISIPNDKFHRTLKTEGTFNIELLQNNLSSDFTTYFTADDFIKLMESLFVIASLPEKGEYFLPCVLPTCDSSQLELVKKDFEDECDPLVLTWEEGTIPQGLFPALVVSLLKSTNKQKFELVEECKRYRNAIQLFNSDVKILLVDAIDRLEVYCTNRKECPNVREQINFGIRSVAAEFKYTTVNPKDSFFSVCNGKTYVCYPNERKTNMTSKCGNCIVPMNDSQLCWFSDNGTWLLWSSIADKVLILVIGAVISLLVSALKIGYDSRAKIALLFIIAIFFALLIYGVITEDYSLFKSYFLILIGGIAKLFFDVSSQKPEKKKQS